MGSESNYSASELRAVMVTAAKKLKQLYVEEFKPQKIRLCQLPDQTSPLTIEQQTLNYRVSVVHNRFVATYELLSAAKLLFVDYDVAQPNDRPELLDQIQAKMDEVGVMMIMFKDEVQELGEIIK